MKRSTIIRIPFRVPHNMKVQLAPCHMPLTINTISVLALLEEGVEVNQFPNLYVCNSLEELSKECYKRKFDVVVGNPPYVRAKNIDEEIKPSLENWKVVTGNADLYIPFYQLGIELLKDHG